MRSFILIPASFLPLYEAPLSTNFRVFQRPKFMQYMNNYNARTDSFVPSPAYRLLRLRCPVLQPVSQTLHFLYLD